MPWRRPIKQSVEMESSGNRALFAAGEPLAVNRPYRALVRTPSDTPADDLVALTASGRRYEIVSLVPAAGEQVLRAAGSAYPSHIADQYLQLPKLPSRVTELARSITSAAATPYDQALAIERYLREYPYDLAITPAPPKQDTVDYFLFDAKTGYCDYYASAMVVLARSLGIPARLATGFATGDYEPAGKGVSGAWRRRAFVAGVVLPRGRLGTVRADRHAFNRAAGQRLGGAAAVRGSGPGAGAVRSRDLSQRARFAAATVVDRRAHGTCVGSICGRSGLATAAAAHFGGGLFSTGPLG